MSTEDRITTLRWKIDKDIELYRFYLDMSVRAVVFLMTVTGAIASYVLAAGGLAGIALAFPALMNGGFALLFFYSIGEARRLSDLHRQSCEELGLPAYNMDPLRSLCQIFCLMCSVAAAGLLLLIGAIYLSPNFKLG